MDNINSSNFDELESFFLKEESEKSVCCSKQDIKYTDDYTKVCINCGKNAYCDKTELSPLDRANNDESENYIFGGHIPEIYTSSLGCTSRNSDPIQKTIERWIALLDYKDRRTAKIASNFDKAGKKISQDEKSITLAKYMARYLIKNYKITRGKNRTAIIATCFMKALQYDGHIISYKKISELFNIEDKSYLTDAINRFDRFMFNTPYHLKNKQNPERRYIFHYLSEIGIPPFKDDNCKKPSNHSRICEHISEFFKNKGSTPSTIAVTSIYWMLQNWNLELNHVDIIHKYNDILSPDIKEIKLPSSRHKKDLLVLSKISERSETTIHRTYKNFINSDMHQELIESLALITPENLKFTSSIYIPKLISLTDI